VKDATKRWRITFPFGLVHGFGFAGALREVAVSRSRLVPALGAFNVGVEVGQLAALAALLPLLAWLRRREWLDARAVKVASALVVIAGAVWLVLRL
jgi:hypothetical protein